MVTQRSEDLVVLSVVGRDHSRTQSRSLVGLHPLQRLLIRRFVQHVTLFELLPQVCAIGGVQLHKVHIDGRDPRGSTTCKERVSCNFHARKNGFTSASCFWTFVTTAIFYYSIIFVVIYSNFRKLLSVTFLTYWHILYSSRIQQYNSIIFSSLTASEESCRVQSLWHSNVHRLNLTITRIYNYYKL